MTAPGSRPYLSLLGVRRTLISWSTGWSKEADFLSVVKETMNLCAPGQIKSPLGEFLGFRENSCVGHIFSFLKTPNLIMFYKDKKKKG